MELSVEFWAQIGIQLIALAFVAGGIIQQIRYLGKQITKLEKKQQKHNNLISRMAVVENKVEDIKEDIQEVKNEYYNS